MTRNYDEPAPSFDKNCGSSGHIMAIPADNSWLRTFPFPWEFVPSLRFHIFYESYDWAEAVLKRGDITRNCSAVVRRVKGGGFRVLIWV